MRALLVGLFAFVLATQAAAAAMQAPSEPPQEAKTARETLTLDQQLERKRAELRKYRGTLRFFERHRRLLTSAAHRSSARSARAHAQSRVRQLTKTVAALGAKVRKRDQRRLDGLRPKAAICEVFGRACDEATAVAWCESRLSTTARNGQYLGLFQMGSSERRLFGHGPSAIDQAEAAHRYFIQSGRDWSPWGCRWAAS